MAIAFDARTGSTTLSYTHTPVGTPRGVLVVMTDFNVATDRVTGVTYGSLALTEPAASPALHDSTEDGACHAFASKSGDVIPTGAQTVTISVTAGTPRSSCTTYTAAADCEVKDSDVINVNGVTGDQTGTLQLGGNTCIVKQVLFSSTGAVTGVNPLTGWTANRENDEGTGCTAEYTYDTVGSTDVTFGATLTTTDDLLVLAVAIGEVVAAGGVSAGPMSGIDEGAEIGLDGEAGGRVTVGLHTIDEGICA